MTVIICDITALRFFRANRFHAFRKPLFARSAEAVFDPERFNVSATEVKRLRLSGIKSIESIDDIHVLVPNARARHDVKGVSFHAWTGCVSANMLIQLSDDLYIITPEFLFLMLARKLDLPLLAEVGMELCGSYELAPYRSRKHQRPESLTSVEKLESFLKTQGHMYGVNKARKALVHVLDNSWSPMETKTYLLLCLPRCQGGYGIPKPQLNYCVNLNSENRPVDGREKFYLDAYWKSSHFAVEYDGKDDHFNRIDIIRDKRRASTLALLSIDTMMLTSADVFNADAMDNAANRIYKRLGIVKNPPNSRMLRKRIELRKMLLFTNA